MMVEPISAYRTSAVYISTAQVDFEYEDIKEELEELGVSPTGIRDIDEDMLAQIKAEKTAETKAPVKSESPANFDTTSMTLLNDMLDKLGISSTNNVNTDVLSLSNKIKSTLLNKDISDAERNLYIHYKLNLDEVISKTGIAVGIFVLTGEMLGATQLGEENKKLLKI